MLMADIFNSYLIHLGWQRMELRSTGYRVFETWYQNSWWYYQRWQYGWTKILDQKYDCETLENGQNLAWEYQKTQW